MNVFYAIHFMRYAYMCIIENFLNCLRILINSILYHKSGEFLLVYDRADWQRVVYH